MEAQLYKGDVKTAEFTPSGADVDAGEVVGAATSIVGVAARDTPDGEPGTLYIDGIFKLAKAAGSGVTFSRGAQVDWDDTGNTAVATGGDFAAGVCVEDAADADDHVLVWINHAPLPAAAA